MARNSKKVKGKTSIRPLLQVLTKQYDSLKVAGSSPSLLKDYSSLVQFLQSANSDEIERIFSQVATLASSSAQSDSSRENQDFYNLTRDEVKRLVDSEDTTRRQLELIAIHRFKVPSGSMRSYSNRQMLVEKLLTLIRNEQAHATIDDVARGQSRHPSGKS